MNRVFSPEPSIELEVIEPTPAQPPASRNLDKQRLTLTAGLGALIGLTAASAAGWILWFQQQQALQQERNLLLIERIRTLNSAANNNAANPPSINSNGPSSELPPAPPEEPWMHELASLPSSSASPARVLQVPANNNIGTPPPPALRIGESRRSRGEGIATSATSTNLPQLVGVIQTPDRSGSAIFQINATSISAAIGETIGGSGWTLRATDADSAVIERNGRQQRVSISSGY